MPMCVLGQIRYAKLHSCGVQLTGRVCHFLVHRHSTMGYRAPIENLGEIADQAQELQMRSMTTWQPG